VGVVFVSRHGFIVGTDELTVTNLQGTESFKIVDDYPFDRAFIVTEGDIEISEDGGQTWHGEIFADFGASTAKQMLMASTAEFGRGKVRVVEE
jgi:hypothetical protein